MATTYINIANLGFLKKNISVHSKNCPFGKKTDTNFLRNSKMLLVPFIRFESDDSDIDLVIDQMKETNKYPGLQNIAKKIN